MFNVNSMQPIPYTLLWSLKCMFSRSSVWYLTSLFMRCKLKHKKHKGCISPLGWVCNSLNHVWNMRNMTKPELFSCVILNRSTISTVQYFHLFPKRSHIDSSILLTPIYCHRLMKKALEKLMQILAGYFSVS